MIDSASEYVIRMHTAAATTDNAEICSDAGHGPGTFDDSSCPRRIQPADDLFQGLTTWKMYSDIVQLID